MIQPSTLGLTPSFGFGDRIGLATPGHLAAVRASGRGIAPIFAQQSIREMARTSRTPEQVMADALRALDAGGWTAAHGADADHLKTPEDVDRTAAAGFTFFTIDPSGEVDGQAADYDAATLRARFAAVQDAAPWLGEYQGRTVRIGDTALTFDEESLLRCAVKYGRAIRAACALARHIDEVHRRLGRPYEIELSVDETPQPTTLLEHYVIADQCLRAGMKLVSLAPRFIGELEKGVDYLGEVAALEVTLAQHATLARQLGPYKLSLHSGSDKLSMYTAFARATRGLFHVKTAGTSYLEALRVAALAEPALFRRICTFSRERYDIDKATYHVHATLAAVPAPEHIPDDAQLEALYLERWADVPAGRGFTAAGRQILHCAFGSVLTHAELGPALRQCLERHPDLFKDVLCEHFGKHLDALAAGLP